MKASELKLLAAVNKENHINILPTQVEFEWPYPIPDDPHNTHIRMQPTPDDGTYTGPRVFRYMRTDAGTLGKRGQVDFPTPSMTDITKAVCDGLTYGYDIPTQASEINISSVTRPSPTRALCALEFIHHPLIFGYLIAELHLGEDWIENAIPVTALSGFKVSDLTPPTPVLSDVIKKVKLSGFTVNNLS